MSDIRAGRVDVLGVGIDNVTMDEALARALRLIEAGGGRTAVTPNAEILHVCGKDAEARRAVLSADLVLPDGAGVVLAAKLQGTPLKGKVAGARFAEALLPFLAERGCRLFLLGGRPGVAEKAAANIRRAHPALAVCGARDGYFSDDGEVLASIAEAKPHVVFVCLGAPRQEKWIARHREAIGAFAIGLGGTIDVLAGEVGWTPEPFVRLRLEWLYRLLREPSRLPRMMKIPLVLMRAAGRRLSGQNKPEGTEP